MLAMQPARDAQAQERVVGSRSIGVGISFESVSFSGRGLAQPGYAGSDSARITAVQQFIVPVSVAVPVAGSWRMDLTALYASGTVQYTDGSSSTGTTTLSGVSDVRIRATGPLVRDGMIVTIGANLPTGHTSLDPTEFAALRVLSAPALGLGSTSVGAGPSGTLGLVLSRPVGEWTVAAGASYEYRGRYQPVSAIAAGAPSADFQPGAVIRSSLAADRLLGSHRLSVAVAADVFATDRLRTQLVASGPGTATSGDEPTIVAAVRLGPVLSADAQLQIAAPALRELLVYSSFRHRTPFSRDGERVKESSASYIESGVRASKALGRRVVGVVALDARWHSGLGVDQGLPTNGVTGAGGTIGVQWQHALLSVQPYLRAQAGSLRATGIAHAGSSQGFGGASAGLVVVNRF